jgi:3-phenylpropionate/trans-cinnamate dioxygenase ferredoxin reductase subunit
VSCARTLRADGFDGSILLAAREADAPYQRPPLSKDYLRGRTSREEITLLGQGWWDDHRVELRPRVSVMKLDPEARTAKLSSKEEVHFDHALLATGANVRRLRADGSDLEGIHYLRAYGNADAIRADATGARRAVVVGGSYIGCEVAAALTELGVGVTVLMQEELVLDRHFGAAVGGFFQRLMEARGVEFVGADALERFEGDGERVSRVVTVAGHELDCDLVVIGAGVIPDVMLARAAKLDLGETGGVRCSSRLETSLSGVYAAGDMAEYDSVLHGRPLRIEHWDVAEQQGRTAALNMLGRDVAHDTVPYFWSDLADWASMEYVGVPPGEPEGRPSAEPLFRGSLEEGGFTAYYTEAGGRLSAALSVGRREDLDEARGWIVEGRTVTAESLRDPRGASTVG